MQTKPYVVVTQFVSNDARKPPVQLLCRITSGDGAYVVVATLKNRETARQIADDLNEIAAQRLK